MPHLIVKLAKGRTEAVRQELSDRLTAVVMDVLGHEADAVSVAMVEVDSKDWMEKVYGPDIAGAEDQLTKRPGYGPLSARAGGAR